MEEKGEKNEVLNNLFCVVLISIKSEKRMKSCSSHACFFLGEVLGFLVGS